MKIAINGFGRIGRLVLRAGLERPDLDFVAVNDLADPASLAYHFTYDSVHGRWPGAAEVEEGDLVIDEHRIRLLREPDASRLPWEELGVEVVLEATGAHRERELAARHLEAGASHVLVSAPAKEMDYTVVLGVNDAGLDPSRHHLISNASCTTNALAPTAMVLHRAFGIEQAFVNTIHGYTLDQSLLDAPRGKGRRDRAAALNLIPTTTGAARAVGLVLPELMGRIDGMAVRTPNPDGSLLDVTAWLERAATPDEIRDAYRRAASSPELKGILAASEHEIVSSDVVGDPHSAVVDLPSVMSQGRLVKVLVWYDNEWGYACRLADLACRIAAHRAGSEIAAAR